MDYPLVEFTQVGSTLVWDRPDITILGWEVTYGEEFLPNAEGGYTVIIRKVKKVANTKLSHQWKWDRDRPHNFNNNRWSKWESKIGF